MGGCSSKKNGAAQVQEPVLLGSETTAPEPEKEPAGDTAPPPAEETVADQAGDAAPPTAEAPAAEPAGETGPPAAVEEPVGAEEPVGPPLAVAEFSVEAAHEEPKENDAAEPAGEPALETKTVPSTWALLTCCGCSKVAEEIPVLKIVKDQKSPAPDEATVAGAAAKEDAEVSLEAPATEPIAVVQAGAVVEQEAAASAAEPSAEPSAPLQAETTAPSQAQAAVEEEAEAPRKERAAPLEGGLGLENDDVEPSVPAAAVKKEVAAPAAPTPTEVAASATPATQ